MAEADGAIGVDDMRRWSAVCRAVSVARQLSVLNGNLCEGLVHTSGTGKTIQVIDSRCR